MLILMSTIEKIILSVGLIILAAVILYVLMILYIKGHKKDRIKRLLTLNMAITYKTFVEYVEFARKESSDYTLYMVGINQFDMVKKKTLPRVLKTWIRHFAKNLSICLPFDGKLAQLPRRDVFILYVPRHDLVEDEFYVMLKNAMSIPFNYQNKHYVFSTSVAAIKNPTDSLDDAILKLQQALIASKRHLGKLKIYSNDLDTSSYEDTKKTLKSSLLSANLYKVVGENKNTYPKYYIEPLINHKDLDEVRGFIDPKDLPWINMMMIRKGLDAFEPLDAFKEISLPVLLKTLEEDNFIESLEEIQNEYRYMSEQIVISLRVSEVNSEARVIRNLQTLKTLGYKISIKLKGLSNEYYTYIKTFGLSRLELFTEVENSKDLLDLLHFIKVNQLELLTKQNADGTHQLEYQESITLTDDKKTRGSNK